MIQRGIVDGFDPDNFDYFNDFTDTCLWLKVEIKRAGEGMTPIRPVERLKELLGELCAGYDRYTNPPHWIIYENAVVSDSAGNPREFPNRGAARHFASAECLDGAMVTTDPGEVARYRRRFRCSGHGPKAGSR